MHYIKGPNKNNADTFSWFNKINDSPCLEGKNPPLEMPYVFEQGCNIFQDAQMIECSLNLTHMNDPGNNLLNYKYLFEQQVEDKKLQKMATRKPENFVIKTFNVYKVLCYINTGNDPDMQWRIALPRQLLIPTIQYFHTILGHPVAKRMHLTMKKRYYHPMLRKEIYYFACNTCQRMKQPGSGY